MLLQTILHGMGWCKDPNRVRCVVSDIGALEIMTPARTLQHQKPISRLRVIMPVSESVGEEKNLPHSRVIVYPHTMPIKLDISNEPSQETDLLATSASKTDSLCVLCGKPEDSQCGHTFQDVITWDGTDIIVPTDEDPMDNLKKK